MTKIAVFMPTRNRREVLPNALYSLSLQETTFPWELCVSDDGSDIDPEPLLKEFFPTVRYKRYTESKGFTKCFDGCFDVISNDVDVIVMQSSDIIHTSPNSLENLVANVAPSKVAIANVVDIEISTDFYKRFDQNMQEILDHWDSYKTTIDLKLGNRIYSCSTQYTSPGSPLFFLGAIMRKDLEKIGFKGCNCDARTTQNMIRFGIIPTFFSELKTIHQRHTKATPICPIEKDCSVYCIRKSSVFQYAEGVTI